MIDQFQWDGRDNQLRSAAERRDLKERVAGFVSRHIFTGRMEWENGDRNGAAIRLWARTVEGFTIARGLSPFGGIARRDAAEIASDTLDHYVLLMRLTGGDFELSQMGRVQTFGPGSCTLMSGSSASVVRVAPESESIYFTIPRTFVDRRVVRGEQLCLRPHRGEAKGLQRMAFETVMALYNNARDISDEEFLKSSQIASELVILAMSTACDSASGKTSLRAANLLRAKRIISKRMADPNLTAKQIARATGLSLSYLYELFHDDTEGSTIREYLKTKRLQRALELLTSPSSRTCSVTTAALESGFTSLSHFSRSFKDAFGVSPREATRRH